MAGSHNLDKANISPIRFNSCCSLSASRQGKVEPATTLCSSERPAPNHRPCKRAPAYQRRDQGALQLHPGAIDSPVTVPLGLSLPRQKMSTEAAGSASPRHGIDAEAQSCRMNGEQHVNHREEDVIPRPFAGMRIEPEPQIQRIECRNGCHEPRSHAQDQRKREQQLPLGTPAGR
jgi:hypothetical protein